MSRKKVTETKPTTAATEPSGAPISGAATAVAETALAEPGVAEAALPTQSSAEGDQTPAKNWGPPYKSIFSCPEKGFEMGEDRRFRQRLFKFLDKPAEHVLTALKEHGFTYRAAEKAWTVNASAENRVLTDRLAREFAGIEQGIVQGFER